MIDAVITWVDGDDPIHKRKREAYLDDTAPVSSIQSTRFASSGEIRFAVQSLLQFCPFLRRIYVVTDDQHPSELDTILAAHSNVRIVDHREAFGEHADLLPVFSSRSIETVVHRIPGLAEHFLYLNDDIFVGRKMKAEDFFDQGIPIIRGNFQRFPSKLTKWLKSKIRNTRPGYNAAQRDAASLVGYRKTYLLAEHQPHPMRRSTLERYYENREAELRAQISHRFRSADQVSPIGMSNHLEILAGARVERPLDVGYVRPNRPTGDALVEVMAKLQGNAFASFCVQSLDQMSQDDRQIVLAGLNAHYAHAV